MLRQLVLTAERTVTRAGEMKEVLTAQLRLENRPRFAKGFDWTTANTALAVVYPALKRGSSTAGPDGFRGSTAGQMDELDSSSHHFIDLCRTRSDRFAIISRYPRKPTPRSEAPASLVEAMRAALSPQTEREPEEHTVIRP
jgi:hypothetical protein